MARAYRTLFAIVGWGSLIFQFVLMVAGQSGWVLLDRVVNYFSFFTILTNVLVALALTGPLLTEHRRLARWSASEGVRASVAMYIAVVGLIYHFILAPNWHPTGGTLIANVLLHYVMPVAFVIDWLVFTPKGRLRWIDPVKWLAYPALYGAWTVGHGLATHWWPYDFINVDKLGWDGFAVSGTITAVFFLSVGLLIVTVDRVFGRRVVSP
ncbi:Pr6Pr family membrane protein [soil metagenome]